MHVLAGMVHRKSDSGFDGLGADCYEERRIEGSAQDYNWTFFLLFYI